MVWFSGPPNII